MASEYTLGGVWFAFRQPTDGAVACAAVLEDRKPMTSALAAIIAKPIQARTDLEQVVFDRWKHTQPLKQRRTPERK